MRAFVNNPGRVAGLWYLLLVLIGPLILIYIPDKLFVKDDATATVARIVANEGLFRAGMAATLVSALVLIMLVMAFWRLFEGVDRRLAALVVILGGVVPVAIDFVGVAIDLATLTVAKGPVWMAAFDTSQQAALAMLLVKLGGHLTVASETLWGAWLLPLGALVWRSGFLPRAIGAWLVLGGISYLALSFVGILWPPYQHVVFTWAQPAFFSEIALTLWLVVRGAPVQAVPETHREPF